MAVASLVLGIMSILFAFIVPVAFIGIILGIIGVILGSISMKKETSPIATGGLVTSIIGVSISLLLYLACMACITGGKKVLDEVVKDPKAGQSIDDFTRRIKELEKEANKSK
jgi:hypothetical protein